MNQRTALLKRGLRPASELAMNRPHGDRLRYLGGCRCHACRGANTAYEKQRAIARANGEWNGLVSAMPAREHLAALSKAGVGRRVVRDVCGVSDTILWAIIVGNKLKVRARTAKAILSVTAEAKADRALIPANATWALIQELLADGYTKAFLAKFMGRSRPALQLGKDQITVRNAFEVTRMYEQLRMVDSAPSLMLIAQLREEGYLITRIEQRVRELAQILGVEFEGLDLNAKRIRANVGRLIKLAHSQMTE